MPKGKVMETDEYAAFVRRTVKALGRRIGEGDVDGLVELVDVQVIVEQAMQLAVDGLRSGDDPYSWAEIGERLGISRQAVQQRYGRKVSA